MTCVVAILVLAVTVLVALVALRGVERDMTGVIGDQQYAFLTSAADFLDERIGQRQEQMLTLAARIPVTARNPVALQRLLASQVGLWGGNDYLDVVVFGRDGKLIASLRAAPSLDGTGQPYFEQTLAQRQCVVSRPFVNRLSGAQVVVVAAPVFDERGQVVLVLAGSIDLQRVGFLRQVASLKPGKTGYLFLMTQDGIVIDHSAESHALQNINRTSGISLADRRAMAGFEGWLEAPGKDGREDIHSYKRLRTTGWILAARYPIKEAFEPLTQMRRNVLFAAAGLAAVAGLLAWLVIYRLLAPLEALRQNVFAIRHHGADIDVLRDKGNDEIGELARAFHELMAERERALARIRIIADNIPAVVAYVNSEERHEFTNAHYKDMLGIDPKSLIGRTIREAYGKRSYARLEQNIRAVLRGERVRYEHAGRVGMRRVHHMIDYIPDVGADGQVVGFYAMAMDISERKLAELEQAASEKRLRLITDNLPVLIAYLDREHRFVFGNATFQKWFGVAPASLVGMPLAELFGAPTYAQALPKLEQAFSGCSVSCELRIVSEGQARIVGSTYVPDVQPDGSVAGVYVLKQDMTHVKEVEEQLMQLARKDTLTGIANRRMFGEMLHQALERARRKGGTLALAYLDIDHFKSINDSFGHGTGDEVLKEFAHRLAACVRATDTPARLSGDEFVIVLEDIGTRQEAERIGAKIAEVLREPFATGKGPLTVTASVGIALWHVGQSQEQLLAAADSALYTAKRRGRDGYAVYEAEDQMPSG